MAVTSQCPIYFYNKGLCDGRNRMKNFFTITLQQGFLEKTVFPCHTRKYFLQKYAQISFNNHVFKAALATKDGFKFDAKVTDVKAEAGFTSFGGKVWEDFARIYEKQPGHELYFTIDEHGTTTKVMPETYPIIHPSYLLVAPEKMRIFDSITATDGTTINWKDMGVVLQEIDKLEGLVNQHNAGLFGQGTVVLLHTLNWTNNRNGNKHVKIAHCVLSQGLEPNDEITIVCRPYTLVHSTYALSPHDGRMCVSGWKEFMEKEEFLRMGDKMLLMLWKGNRGIFLFVSYIPELSLCSYQAVIKLVLLDLACA